MELFELTDEDQPVIEAKIVWARKGRSITKKYRCTFGKRKGRLVANPAQCSKPIDLKKPMIDYKISVKEISKQFNFVDTYPSLKKASKIKRTYYYIDTHFNKLGNRKNLLFVSNLNKGYS